VGAAAAVVVRVEVLDEVEQVEDVAEPDAEAEHLVQQQRCLGRHLVQ
jgi:hypothetical protein